MTASFWLATLPVAGSLEMTTVRYQTGKIHRGTSLLTQPAPLLSPVGVTPHGLDGLLIIWSNDSTCCIQGLTPSSENAQTANVVRLTDTDRGATQPHVYFQMHTSFPLRPPLRLAAAEKAGLMLIIKNGGVLLLNLDSAQTQPLELPRWACPIDVSWTADLVAIVHARTPRWPRDSTRSLLFFSIDSTFLHQFSDVAHYAVSGGLLATTTAAGVLVVWSLASFECLWTCKLAEIDCISLNFLDFGELEPAVLVLGRHSSYPHCTLAWKCTNRGVVETGIIECEVTQTLCTAGEAVLALVKTSRRTEGYVVIGCNGFSVESVFCDEQGLSAAFGWAAAFC